MKHFTFAILILILPSLVLAANSIDGTYSCSGDNPGASGSCQGTMTINQSRAIYNITWTVGPFTSFNKNVSVERLWSARKFHLKINMFKVYLDRLRIHNL